MAHNLPSLAKRFQLNLFYTEKDDTIHQSMPGTSYSQCWRETAQIWYKEEKIVVELQPESVFTLKKNTLDDFPSWLEINCLVKRKGISVTIPASSSKSKFVT